MFGRCVLWNEELYFLRHDADVEHADWSVYDTSVDADERMAWVVDAHMAGAPYVHSLVAEETSCKQKPKSMKKLCELWLGYEGYVKQSVIRDCARSLPVTMSRSNAERHTSFFYGFSAELKHEFITHALEQ